MSYGSGVRDVLDILLLQLQWVCCTALLGQGTEGEMDAHLCTGAD
jgi:hypothetical protein